jgi:YfiR/HmsC-like
MTRVVSLILLLGAALELCAQATVPGFDEYQVKAAFLYNFAKFVQWPAGTFANSTDPIGICIAGVDPFGSALDAMVQGKKIGERVFAVRRIPDTQQAKGCQILFIGSTEWKRIRSLLLPLKGAAILTVGETDDFTAAGGMIAFQIAGPRVRIQIDIETAERCGLKISSKLLSLAEIVKRQP